MNIYCDATTKNGRIGLGVVLECEHETLTLSEALPGTDCNAAEAHALLLALRKVRELKAHAPVVHCDNRVIIEHVMGAKRSSIAALETLYQQAREALAQLPGTRITWIPRHKNLHADQLARAALGLPPKVRRTRFA